MSITPKPTSIKNSPYLRAISYYLGHFLIYLDCLIIVLVLIWLLFKAQRIYHHNNRASQKRSQAERAGLVSLVFMTAVIFLGAGQESSWAAPVSHPHLQTIPTRPPASTPPPAEPTGKNDPDQKSRGTVILVQPLESTVAIYPAETEAGDYEDATQPILSSGLNNNPAEAPGPSQPIEPEPPASPAPLNPQKPSTEPAQPDLSVPTGQPAATGSSLTIPAPAEPLASPSTTALLSDQLGPLAWLYALALGLVLILSGIFLVKRA